MTHEGSIDERRRLFWVSIFVVIPTVGLIAGLIVRLPGGFDPILLLWSVLITGVEYLPVPAWRGLTLSVGFPLLIAVAILYPAGAAGLITFLGATDPREFRREVSFDLALFNRSQVALSVIAASSVFHAFNPAVKDLNQANPVVLIGAASLAAVADYAVNASLVTLYMSTKLRISPLQMLRQLTIGNLRDFLVGYLGLGLLGLTQAVLFQSIGAWSLPVFLAPLLFARQMFFRTHALEEAHVELKEREEILRDLSNTMAEERADERLQIAGYLHDDLAQVLFRLSLQVDVARKLLDKNDFVDLRQQLEKIRESKQETSDRIRALIRELHRSPLGAKGLAEALESFTDEVGRDSGVQFKRDVQDLDLPAPIALLVFQIAREAIFNALKHARATEMSISVTEDEEDIVLRLMDNGVGFDTSVPGPEGHYGMATMRERAKVGGGSFDVASEPGEGTTIVVRFPIALLQRDQAPEGSSPNGSAGHVVPGAIGGSPRTSEGAGPRSDAGRSR